MKLRSGRVLRSGRSRSPKERNLTLTDVSSPADTTSDVKQVTNTKTCTRRLSPRNHSSSTQVTPRSTHNMRLRSQRNYV